MNYNLYLNLARITFYVVKIKYILYVNYKSDKMSAFNTIELNNEYQSQYNEQQKHIDELKKIIISSGDLLEGNSFYTHLSLNINPDLNQYGYATTNPEASEYYKARGFMNPVDGVKFADSVSYMLSHPYQTRYCEKQN